MYVKKLQTEKKKDGSGQLVDEPQDPPTSRSTPPPLSGFQVCRDCLTPSLGWPEILGVVTSQQVHDMPFPATRPVRFSQCRPRSCSTLRVDCEFFFFFRKAANIILLMVVVYTRVQLRSSSSRSVVSPTVRVTVVHRGGMGLVCVCWG